MNNGEKKVLTQAEAGIFLGISQNTIRRLIKQGYIRAFQIPHPLPRFRKSNDHHSRVVRIRVEELERLITENDITGGLCGPNRSHWINAHTCRKIPVALIARIMGMTGSAVSTAILRGSLSPTPEGVYNYIRSRSERELTTKIHAKYRAKVQTLQQQLRRYQKRAKHG